MAGDTKDDALTADWVEICRRSVTRMREVFSGHPATRDRAVGTGRGAGGDETLVIDGFAEAAVFEELEGAHRQGHDFTAISEERGVVVFGESGSDVRVVIDPIDGSLNAKRLLPTYALSIAVASGPSMEDVELGYVYDFGAGEEYIARRDRGATLDGATLDAETGAGRLEVVGLESARPAWLAPVVERLRDDVYRIRVVGSIAVSLCYVGAARFDGMLSANTCRSVDAAAGQLIAREAGAFVSFLGHGGVEAPLDLDARYRVCAARTPEGLDTLASALTSAGLPDDQL
jgi:myo-inositol-1(or 4)-monophosphatase